MCRGRFAFLPVACCRAAAFFQNPQGRAENAQAWGLETSANQSDRLQIYAEQTHSIAAVPQKQTGDSRFAVPQRIFSNPTNWVERTRSTAATLPRSPEFAVANSQCLNAPPNPSRIWQNQIRSAATHLLKSHEFGKAKFAVPQRNFSNPTNLR